MDGLSLQYYWRQWPHYRSPAEFRNVCNCTPIVWCCSIKHGGTSNWTFAQQRCRECLTTLGFSFLRQGELRIMPHHSQNGCFRHETEPFGSLTSIPTLLSLLFHFLRGPFPRDFPTDITQALLVPPQITEIRPSIHYVHITKPSVWIYNFFKFLQVRIPSWSVSIKHWH
jgi:hypothetical protein